LFKFIDGGEIEKLKKTKKSVIVKTLVSEEEAKDISHTIRFALINAGILKNDMKRKLFDAFESEDKVSIHELERVFKRRPLMVNKELANKMARFIIEPRKNSTVEYNELMEENLGVVLEKLSMLMPDYIIYDENNENLVRECLTVKLNENPEILKQLLQQTNDNEYSELSNLEQKINESLLHISQSELDYLALIGYRSLSAPESFKIPLKAIYQFLYNLIDNGMEPAVENLNKNIELEKPQASSAPNQDQEEYIDMDEEKMIEIAQKCFTKIAEKVKSKKLTLEKIYGEKIFTQEIEGEEATLLSPEDFIEGLRKIDITDLETIEYACLIKVLAVNDEEKLIKFDDLVQILFDYGVNPGPEVEKIQKEKNKDLNFESLDNISMIIMLALTEYLIKSKISIQDFLGEKIFKASPGGNSDKKLDLINSKDFFAKLEEIGVKIEDEEHENLKIFLSADKEKRGKISILKLKKTVEEFALNETLREKARKYYEEMAENVEDEEEEQALQNKGSDKKKSSGKNRDEEAKEEYENLGEINQNDEEMLKNFANEEEVEDEEQLSHHTL